MFLLSSFQKVLVLVFMTASMLSIGMQSGTAELRSLLERRGLLFRSLAANFIVVPLLGILLARLLPVPPAAAGALILLGCTPGGLSALQFTSKVKGEAALAGAFLVLSGLLAVLVSPAMLELVLPRGVDIALPYGRALGFIAIAMLLPLGVGLGVCDKAPAGAAKLGKLMAVAGMIAFVTLMVVTGDQKKEALKSIGLPAVAAMALFFVASMAIGWFLGGPERNTRQLMATSTSMRNAALCLAIAQSTPAGDAVMAPLIAFSLMMVPPNMLFTVYNAVRAKRAAGRGRES